MTASTSVVFFGSEEFSAPSLQALIKDSSFQVEAVVTRPDSRRGRSSKLIAPLVKQIAQQHGIDVLQPSSKSELQEMTASLSAELAVLVSYGMIIPQSVIDHFSDGIINVHPSKLPELRGPAPIEYTILEGKDELWISIMKLDAGMDTGPVYAQAGLPIDESLNATELSAIAADRGADLLLATLPQIITGTLQPTPQDKLDLTASYSNIIKKADGSADPTIQAAKEIERMVRAYAGWPGVKIDHKSSSLTLHSVGIADGDHADEGALFVSNKKLYLRCAHNSFLEITSLQPPGKQPMTAADFINGYL